MQTPLYQHIASIAQAISNCERMGNNDWLGKHIDRLERIADNYLPSGSGIDSGCKIDVEKSHGEKIVITSSFHNMDEYGGYCGWIDFTVTIKPSLWSDIHITITGRFGPDQDLKEYLHEVFDAHLREVKDWYNI